MVWAYEKDPTLYELSERKLMAKYQFNDLDCRLRLKFWDEYTVAQDRGVSMKLANILKGACSAEHWKRVFTKDHRNIVWLLCPPSDYEACMEEMLYKSTMELRDILDLPNYDRDGKLDRGLLKLKKEIHELAANRVRGAVIQKLAIQQKIDQRTQVIGGHRDPLVENHSMDDLKQLDSELAKVNRQLKASQSRAQNQVIELTKEGEQIEESNKHDA
jgi:hypothetical protein